MKNSNVINGFIVAKEVQKSVIDCVEIVFRYQVGAQTEQQAKDGFRLGANLYVQSESKAIKDATNKGYNRPIGVPCPVFDLQEQKQIL